MGSTSWGAIGVSENVIEASWEALVDSLEAGMLPGRSERTRRGREPDATRAAPVREPLVIIPPRCLRRSSGASRRAGCLATRSTGAVRAGRVWSASSSRWLLPAALWHRAIAIIAEDFRLELAYLVTGWTAYVLIAARAPLRGAGGALDRARSEQPPLSAQPAGVRRLGRRAVPAGHAAREPGPADRRDPGSVAARARPRPADGSLSPYIGPRARARRMLRDRSTRS